MTHQVDLAKFVLARTAPPQATPPDDGSHRIDVETSEDGAPSNSEFSDYLYQPTDDAATDDGAAADAAAVLLAPVVRGSGDRGAIASAGPVAVEAGFDAIDSLYETGRISRLEYENRTALLEHYARYRGLPPELIPPPEVPLAQHLVGLAAHCLVEATTKVAVGVVFGGRACWECTRFVAERLWPGAGHTDLI